MKTLRLAHLTAIVGLASCASERPPAPGCSAGNGGITLPDGFCASVFADSIGVARHLAVGPDGTVYVALENATGSSAGTTKASGEAAQGGLGVVKDTTRAGRADARDRIRTDGGTGIARVDS